MPTYLNYWWEYTQRTKRCLQKSEKGQVEMLQLKSTWKILQNKQKRITTQNLAIEQTRHYKANKKTSKSYTGGTNGGEKMMTKMLSEAQTGTKLEHI